VSGSIHVFTFKRGLLSRAAHDLRLSVQHYTLHRQGEAVEASFDPLSLQVDGTMKRGRLAPGGLSPKDKGEVLDNTRSQVLQSHRYPKIRFDGRAVQKGALIAVAGTLELVGQRRPVTFTLRQVGGRVQGELELQPSRWGIKPFKALMGAIALDDRVVVAFDLPTPENDTQGPC